MRPPSWMVWNLFLAAIPLVLSVCLFRLAPRRTFVWWLGVAVFVVFLPNAPYVLSDTIHLVRWLRAGPSWPRAILLLVGFGTFFLIGLEAYALCITNVRHYLHQYRSVWFTAGVELLLHGISAVGVYVGRVHRFNSWDVVDEWHAITANVVSHLSRPWPFMVVAFTFVVTAVLCEALVRVNLLALKMAGRDSPES